MLLANNFTYDSRVKREARSLAACGCEVIVLAMGESDLSEDERPDSFEVQRWAASARSFPRLVAAVVCWSVRPLMRWLLGMRPRAETASRHLADKRRWPLPAIVTQLGFNAELARRACMLEPDVVHSHDLDTLFAGVLVKRLTGAKLVYDSHELYLHRNGATWRTNLIWRWIEWFGTGDGLWRARSRVPDEFITVNEEIAAKLRRLHRRLPEAVIVKNAIAQPKHPVKSNGRLHAAIGLDPSQRLLLFHGGLVRGRGLEALVQAGPLLPKGWSVVLMGHGVQEHALRELAKRTDPTAERIHFVPAVGYDVLLEWVAGATLGIIAYDNVCMNHWLCSPNKLWEYPGAGVPAIVSPFPLLRRVVERNDIGWLLPDPITSAGIAETVSSIDHRDLHRKQQNCRAFIAHDNWSKYEARLLQCYERLLGRSMKASSVPQSAERDPAHGC